MRSGSYNSAAMPIMDLQTLDFISYSYDQTLRYGVKLGQLLRSEDLLCLTGHMGSGKTSLAIGIARGWGALEPANSPSYILVNEYTRADGAQLHHMDCYRLDNWIEGDHLCVDERLNSGVSVMIEWSENVEEILPKERLLIKMKYLTDEKRSIEVSANGDRFVSLLADFRKSAFQ